MSAQSTASLASGGGRGESMTKSVLKYTMLVHRAMLLTTQLTLTAFDASVDGPIGLLLHVAKFSFASTGI